MEKSYNTLEDIINEMYSKSAEPAAQDEVSNEGANGRLRENMTDSQTTVPLVDARFFPNSGTVYIDNELIRRNAAISQGNGELENDSDLQAAILNSLMD